MRRKIRSRSINDSDLLCPRCCGPEADGDAALAWSYDGANRVATAETVADIFTVQPATVLTHAYDAVGNRTDLTHGPDAVIVDGAWGYLHDGRGNLTRVTAPTMENVELFYDAASRLERIVSANTVATEVAYDPATGRPQNIAHRQGAATLAGFGYGFDVDGKITAITDADGTRNFAYDATQQVTAGGYASAPESYAYDPEGNRTASHLSVYTTGTANRLIEDADACYAYDANGNLETKIAKVGVTCTGGVTAYTWDVLNRLTAIDFADGTAAQYRYDAQGRRIEKSVNGALTRYVYDDDAILLEYDGGNGLQARYSHGEEIDQPLAMARGGQSYFYQVDHLGSIRLLTDAAGAIVNRYDYDAFGNLEATSFEGITNPYAFTARERDAESGLMFYRARYYDPKVGRFISEDPIGFEARDLNVYRYVFNDATNIIDPTGEIITVANYARSPYLILAGQGLSPSNIILTNTITRTVITISWKGALTGATISGAIDALNQLGQYPSREFSLCRSVVAVGAGAIGGGVGGFIAPIFFVALAVKAVEDSLEKIGENCPF